MPQALWSGNLRLSLVIVPVKLYSALDASNGISFRMIHEPSGEAIHYAKGIQTDNGFEEVEEDEIVKGYEHEKGKHVLIRQQEIDELKLEAKHTINMETFVDRSEIDARYIEKPYYLMPDGDAGEEGFIVLRDALAKTDKVAVGQIVMGGREHLVGILAHTKGLMMVILRYEDELRKSDSYFDRVTGQADPEAVKLAVDLIEEQSGKFEPKKMPNDFAEAVRALVQTKLGKHAPQVAIEIEKREPTKVVNIMDALQKSMKARKHAKVRDVVGKKSGKAGAKNSPAPAQSRGKRPTAH